MLTEFYIEALLVNEELETKSGRLGIRGRLMARLRGWRGGSLLFVRFTSDTEH